MASPDEFIDLAELSQQLFDDVRDRLWLYTGSLYTPQRPHTYSGTCTFVSIAGLPYLLTAAHAWTALLRHEGFALSLEEHVQLHAIHHSIAKPAVLLTPEPTNGEYGPDLALIPIPEADASWIRVRKSFYNLDRHAPVNIDEPPSFSLGFWALNGCVAEQSSFGPTEAHMGMRLYATSDPAAFERGDYDYVDVRFDRRSRPHLPQSFGGVSGAGLWQVKLLKSRSTGAVSIGSVHLEGVAFYQIPLSEHAGLIRCHGRKSLYARVVPSAKC